MHFVGFFYEPDDHRHGANIFTVIPPHFCRLLTRAWGYGRRIFVFNPSNPHGVPAGKIVLTMHNAKHGCLYCLEPGEVVPSGKGHCRAYLIEDEPAAPRTGDMFKAVGTRARETGLICCIEDYVASAVQLGSRR